MTTIIHETPLKTVNGIFHELELYSDRLVMRPTDILSRFFGHDEVIPLSAIKAVHVYPSQFITTGWLRLVVTGEGRKPLGMAFRRSEEHQVYELQAMLTDLISRHEVLPVLRELRV